MLRRVASLLAAVLAVAALAGCRLDVAVDLTLGAGGTGELTITATTDADVVNQAPGLAEALVFDDAVAVGWTVEGPTATEAGGLTVMLRHPVGSAEEATNLLLSLGPPFTDVRLQRTADGDEVTTVLSGALALPAADYDAFADGDLLGAVGGTPFADELAASATTPASAMAVTFTAALPGEISETTGESDGGRVRWTAPLDGTSADVSTTAVQRPPSGGRWAGPVSWLALLALVAWIVAAGVFIAYVIRARQQRSRRHDALLERRFRD